MVLRPWAFAFVVAGACADSGVTPDECSIACSAALLCPQGSTCLSDGFCHEDPGAELCGEAAAPDAAPAAQPDASEAPATPDGAAGVTDEELVLGPSMVASVYRDFSAAHEFRPNDFTDGTTMLDNAPRRLVLLDAPFAPGLAVVAGRTVIELRADGDVVAHDFAPAAANGQGPDAFSDGRLVDASWSRGAGLLMAAASPGAGDGLYRIPADWSTLERVTTTQDVRAVEWDAVGNYSSLGPALYLALPAGIYFMNPTSFGANRIVEFDATDVRQTTDGNFLGGRAGNRIVRVAPGVADTGLAFESLVLAGSDTSEAPDRFHAIKDASALVELSSVDAFVPLARTDTPDWRWLDVVLVTNGPLGSANGAFYILESNRLLDRDRVIVIRR